MLPMVRPEQVFGRSCEEYTSQLGVRQATAFTLLWGLPGAVDPIAVADEAAFHVHQEILRKDSVKILPQELQAGLYAGADEVLRRFSNPDPDQRPSDHDLCYIELFLVIAAWQHEIVEGNLGAFIDGLYE